MARHAQLYHEVVDYLLRAALVERSARYIAFKIYIKEGRDAPERHSRAVLLLYRAEVGEVEPLHRFARARGGTGNVVSVKRRHLFELAEKIYLLVKLFEETYLVLEHDAGIGDRGLVLLLLFNEPVDAVERGAAVVAYYAPASVRVRQPRDDTAVARRLYLVAVHAKDAVVVRRPVLELALYFIGESVAVGLARLARHRYAAERIHPAAQRPVRLEADDYLRSFVDIARAVVRQRSHRLRVYVQHASELALELEKARDLLHKPFRPCRRAAQERFSALVGGVVGLNKIPDVDRSLPLTGLETLPFFVHNSVPPNV